MKKKLEKSLDEEESMTWQEYSEREPLFEVIKKVVTEAMERRKP